MLKNLGASAAAAGAVHRVPPKENGPHRIAVGGLMLANSAPRKGLEKRQGWTPPRAFELGCAWPRRRGALPQAAVADRLVDRPSANRAWAGPTAQVRPVQPLLRAARHSPGYLGRVVAWAVSCPRQHDDGEEPGKAMKNILGRIDGRLGGIGGVDAALKRRNARKFCTYMLAE